MSDTRMFRHFYAVYVCGIVGVRSEAIIQAFAKVPREDFLGPGPWQVLVEDGHVMTPTADPALLYQDMLVAIDPEQGINNGEPSLHAGCLGAVRPSLGESVLHVGCGTGYYTALLAELVGPEGRVAALEIHAGIAARAARYLAPWKNVEVDCRSGSLAPLPMSDIIYVSAGASEPLRVWLSALSPKGRMVFPLTPGSESGGMLVVTRTPVHNVFVAEFISMAGFFPCFGGQSPADQDALAAAFADPGWREVKSLHLDSPPDASCWYAGKGWWLSTVGLPMAAAA